jgi:HTH-type transcriptional regulator / antitoxin HigA
MTDIILEVRPIRTAADYEHALGMINQLWAAEPGTEEFDYLDALATLVEAYEAKHHPAPDRDPIEAIEDAMAAHGYARADLAALVGQSRATELLQRKRPLSLDQMRKINQAWSIPMDVLTKEYPLAP